MRTYAERELSDVVRLQACPPSLELGSVSVAAVECGLSLRHFQRRFKERVGVSPKLHARIARFQSAVDAKLADPNRTWLGIAHALQFHDQMHMIHDFQKLAKHSPSSLLPELGDLRPPGMISRSALHEF